MSVEYYLLCKQKFKNIIENLNEIIKIYENIFSYTKELDTINAEYYLDNFNLIETIEQLNIKINYAKCCKEYCNQKAQQMCNHEFVTDMIDIHPERSQNITFCKICEYTISN